MLEYMPLPWRLFCLEKFLRVQVPLRCVKTAFVSQVLGSREFVKTMEVSTAFVIKALQSKKGYRENDKTVTMAPLGFLNPPNY